MKKCRDLVDSIRELLRSNALYWSSERLRMLVEDLTIALETPEESDLDKFRTVLSRLGPVTIHTHGNRASIEVSDFVGFNSITFLFENGRLVKSS